MSCGKMHAHPHVTDFLLPFVGTGVIGFWLFMMRQKIRKLFCPCKLKHFKIKKCVCDCHSLAFAKN